MKKNSIIAFILISINFVSAQSMLDMNEPLAIKKAQIKRCTEVCNGEDLFTMYYDTNGFQIRNSFFCSKVDTNGNFVDGYYGKTYFKYDKIGNLIEKKFMDPLTDPIPLKTINYFYNNENQLIKKELCQIFNKVLTNTIDTLKVVNQYFYSKTLLIKDLFISSKETVETNYSYDNSNQLNLITIKENNNLLIQTNVFYSGDTTFHKKFDTDGNEIYVNYQIKDDKNKIKELYVWDKLRNSRHKNTFYYNEIGLLSKIEEFNYNSTKLKYTTFKYE